MRRARLKPWRRWPARAWAALALITLLFGVALQGRSYIACAVMQSVHWAACCPGLDHDGDEAPAAQRKACCVERSFSMLPAAGGAPAAAPLASLAVPFLPPPGPEPIAFAPALAPLPPVPARRWRSREGPAPPAASSERLARLGRLLC
ncbi:MAG TPA: hypothetical protein VFS43_46175 [Polyangiaceae bacterium]|nr:hypothetical protein [Polyangiaceae bacterium]